VRYLERKHGLTEEQIRDLAREHGYYLADIEVAAHRLKQKLQPPPLVDLDRLRQRERSKPALRKAPPKRKRSVARSR
jgi:hypothetical protein